MPDPVSTAGYVMNGEIPEAAYQRPLPHGWIAEFSDEDGRLRFIDTLQIPNHVTFDDPRENDALYPRTVSAARRPTVYQTSDPPTASTSQEQSVSKAQKPSYSRSSRLLHNTISNLVSSAPTNNSPVRSLSIGQLAVLQTAQNISTHPSSIDTRQVQWQRTAVSTSISQPSTVQNNLSAIAGAFAGSALARKVLENEKPGLPNA